MNVTERILGILKEKGIEYELLEHEPVYTSEQAAKARGVELRTGVKALVLKTASGKFVLVLVRADRKADLEKVKGLVGEEVKLASPAEVLEVTGCEVGSVPPFGHDTKLRTFMDRGILENEISCFNCGLHTKSIKMRPKDLKGVCAPEMF